MVSSSHSSSPPSRTIMETTIHGADSHESIEVTSSLAETLELSPDPSPLLDEAATTTGASAASDALYVSSSSEDEEDAKNAPDVALTVTARETKPQQSEWDKALQSGRPSEGKAAADLFAAPSTDTEDVAIAGASASATKTTTNNTNNNISNNRSFSSASDRFLARPTASMTSNTAASTHRPHPDDSDVSSGVLPDVLMSMRQTIESSFMGFDSDMLRLAEDNVVGSRSSLRGGNHSSDDDDDPLIRESRESLKRSSQQSISAAVLVSLAHKRYERRRLAAMEIEKVVRSLVLQNEMERIRAILLLLSDDYVRSANEDARKGGVVALAACAIGLKKANDNDPMVLECRDLILASVVHGCQCHSQRVRYYATESLFNVVKVMPNMAVQHFFILFEILRSLYADVDVDVRSGAELLDKKLKEVIVHAMNNNTAGNSTPGGFAAEDCIPVFARFVHMRNKATKRLTLTWLQELNEKLVASPILEFLHLFLGGIFDMVGDPSLAIRQSALAFLHSVLPKLLVVVNTNATEGADDIATKGVLSVDFDKVLQSLVTTMEHPDPFVRKIAMYWMSRIVKAHLSETAGADDTKNARASSETDRGLSSAAVSIRNALPHILPGIFLSIGDDYQPPSGATKDFFLPDQSTRLLAEQTNQTLQDAVRRNGPIHVQHLDGFIVALREELDDGLAARHPPAVDRLPYRMDVVPDGTGIESPGWFSASRDSKDRGNDSMIMSRLCALQWVTVLYESVVPVSLKADYAREFVYAIINQLVDNPPDTIIYKSLEVLAKITVPVAGEDVNVGRSTALSSLAGESTLSSESGLPERSLQFPMTESSISYAFNIVDPSRQRFFSRDRDVFSALVELHACNGDLLSNLSNVITYMCRMQPPEFVYVSFAVEIERFMLHSTATSGQIYAKRLQFVSSFIQHMSHVLLNTPETKPLRDALQDCVSFPVSIERDRQRSRLFHIVLHAFSHNLASTVSLCFWAGAYRTIQMFLIQANPLDMNLVFFLEIDRFVEMLERPLFRHLHVRMLERDSDSMCEGSGTMLFQALKSLVMILPQSACYFVLRDRLTSVARFRQSAVGGKSYSSRLKARQTARADSDTFLSRVQKVRAVHCAAAWETLRADSLEVPLVPVEKVEEGVSRREWLGYADAKADLAAQENYRRQKTGQGGKTVEEITEGFDELASKVGGTAQKFIEHKEDDDELDEGWRDYWRHEQEEI